MLREMDYKNIEGMAMGRAKFKATMARMTGTKKTPNGLVLYKGPSALDPDVDIVAIVTGLVEPTRNPKIGDMLQVWILREDMAPNVASKTGQDVAICGDCPHRRSQGGSCYVDPSKAALSIWKAYRNGNYPEVNPKDAALLMAGMWVRFGAYGDPSAVPLKVWNPVALTTKKHTGYTRQWRNLDATKWGFLMASTMTEAETNEASALGWRTFRVRVKGAEVRKNEVECLNAKDDSIMPITCAACGLCAGIKDSKRTAKSITVEVHGYKAYVQRFEKQVAA